MYNNIMGFALGSRKECPAGTFSRLDWRIVPFGPMQINVRCGSIALYYKKKTFESFFQRNFRSVGVRGFRRIEVQSIIGLTFFYSHFLISLILSWSHAIPFSTRNLPSQSRQNNKKSAKICWNIYLALKKESSAAFTKMSCRPVCWPKPYLIL